MTKKRYVVKVGSSSLAAPEGGLDDAKASALVEAIARLKQSGHDVVLVSSGAVACGYRHLGYRHRPRTLEAKQAAAAVGQTLLMQSYAAMFAGHGIQVAQILLTRSDFSDRERYRHALQTLTLLLARGVVPVINENDTVSVAELTFGDNDTLGALVAGMLHADLYIMLTDTDGLYEQDPRKHPGARRITHLDSVTAETEAMAGKPGAMGTGGMRSKLTAARTALHLGVPSFIGRLAGPESLCDVTAGAGAGTYIGSVQDKRRGGNVPARKQWIALHSPVRGRIRVDRGAAEAIVHQSKSLLAAGIAEVEGSFDPGEVVEVYLSDQLLGRGVCRFSAAELRTFLTRPVRPVGEVIHRDQWVTLPQAASITRDKECWR